MHPRWNVTEERYQKVTVALSISVMWNSVKRPLADKSLWRQYNFVISDTMHPRKSYYGTPSESHGRSFRNCYEELRKVTPGREITMTSYPAYNKTSLSRKTFIPDKKWLREAKGKSWMFLQNPSLTCKCSVPWRRTDDDVISGWQ